MSSDSRRPKFVMHAMLDEAYYSRMHDMLSTPVIPKSIQPESHARFIEVMSRGYGKIDVDRRMEAATHAVGDLETLIQQGTFSVNLDPPLDQQTTLHSSDEVRELLSYFDFQNHYGGIVIGSPSEEQDSVRLRTSLRGKLTDEEHQVRLELEVLLQVIYNGGITTHRSLFLPNYDDIQQAETLIAKLFPSRGYVPDLFHVSWSWCGDPSLRSALMVQYPAHWIPYDPSVYHEAVSEVQAEGIRYAELLPAIATDVPIGREDIYDRPERKIHAEQAIEGVHFPQPPKLQVDTGLCRTCVGFDAAVHYPIRTLFSLSLSDIPTRSMVRNRLITLHASSISGIGSRPDSPLMQEIVTYARASPELFEYITTEIEKLRKEEEHRLQGVVSFLQGWGGRFLDEVETYLRAWQVVQTMPPKEIAAGWHAGKEAREEKTRGWAMPIYDITTEDIALLYAASYLRVAEVKDDICDTLEGAKRATGYFAWLLAYTLGEVGDRGTATYLTHLLQDPERDSTLEFTRELIVAIGKINHRLGQQPSLDNEESFERYLRTLQSEPSVALGMQYGSRIQMRQVTGIGVDTAQTCIHEEYIRSFGWPVPIRQLPEGKIAGS